MLLEVMLAFEFVNVSMHCVSMNLCNQLAFGIVHVPGLTRYSSYKQNLCSIHGFPKFEHICYCSSILVICNCV